MESPAWCCLLPQNKIRDRQRSSTIDVLSTLPTELIFRIGSALDASQVLRFSQTSRLLRAILLPLALQYPTVHLRMSDVNRVQKFRDTFGTYPELLSHFRRLACTIHSSRGLRVTAKVADLVAAMASTLKHVRLEISLAQVGVETALSDDAMLRETVRAFVENKSLQTFHVYMAMRDRSSAMGRENGGDAALIRYIGDVLEVQEKLVTLKMDSGKYRWSTVAPLGTCLYQLRNCLRHLDMSVRMEEGKFGEMESFLCSFLRRTTALKHLHVSLWSTDLHETLINNSQITLDSLEVSADLDDELLESLSNKLVASNCRSLENLSNLSLAGANYVDRSVRMLAAALIRSRTIKNLHLRVECQESCSHESIQSLTRALAHSESCLESLSLQGTFLTPADMRLIARAISRSPRITHIGIIHVQRSAIDSVHAFATTLCHPSSSALQNRLLSLDFGGNYNLGRDGWETVQMIVKEMKVIKEVRLDYVIHSDTVNRMASHEKAVKKLVEEKRRTVPGFSVHMRRCRGYSYPPIVLYE
ncbi:hypothetical protein BJ742DRAFT_769620 [Cladochytrium replicatum]|nr:hypothetical protein BJ742DRAFT_769620 [Cladochytrium replicatum]